jgi:hypothetical protein
VAHVIGEHRHSLRISCGRKICKRDFPVPPRRPPPTIPASQSATAVIILPWLFSVHEYADRDLSIICPRHQGASSISDSTMAPKRPLEDDADSPKPKKHRTGFKIGPDNLPDGTHRRKGTYFPPPPCLESELTSRQY